MFDALKDYTRTSVGAITQNDIRKYFKRQNVNGFIQQGYVFSNRNQNVQKLHNLVKKGNKKHILFTAMSPSSASIVT